MSQSRGLQVGHSSHMCVGACVRACENVLRGCCAPHVAPGAAGGHHLSAEIPDGWSRRSPSNNRVDYHVNPHIVCVPVCWNAHCWYIERELAQCTVKSLWLMSDSGAASGPSPTESCSALWDVIVWAPYWWLCHEKCRTKSRKFHNCLTAALHQDVIQESVVHSRQMLCDHFVLCFLTSVLLQGSIGGKAARLQKMLCVLPALSLIWFLTLAWLQDDIRDKIAQLRQVLNDREDYLLSKVRRHIDWFAFTVWVRKRFVCLRRSCNIFAPILRKREACLRTRARKFCISCIAAPIVIMS